MKKIIKKLLILIFVFCSFITIVSAETQEEKLYSKNYSIIMLADEIQQLIIKDYNISEIYKDMYPQYYGGIYISDDSESVIIQIVEQNIPNVKSREYELYKKIMNYNPKIKIEYVENSFNELNVVNNLVSDYIVDRNEDKNVIGCYIDVINNRVIIETKSNYAANIQKYLNIIDGVSNNTYSFVESSVPELFSTTIYSGGQILTYSDNGTTWHACSMGFRTYYNGQAGFVTAGHCLKNGSSVLSSIPSGSVSFSIYGNNVYYDYGFVAVNSNYSPSNYLAYDSNGVTKLGVYNYCPTITVNMSIAKSGASSQYTTGSVTGLNQTLTLGDGTVIKGLVKSDVYGEGGDSGAPVFIPQTNSQGGAIPIGVVSGGNTGTPFLHIGHVLYFTSINNMYSSIQSGRY